MSKYLYTYRWECLQSLMVNLSSWAPRLDSCITFKAQDSESALILTHAKSHEALASAWNRWRFLGGISFSNNAYSLIKTIAGGKSSEISQRCSLPEGFDSWEEWWLHLLVLELDDYPTPILEFLLKGMVRF
ncbi:MAG TPA: hypothetical protein VJ044_19505 [Candidatus Hodarchaeales archaeon]|nr:hypothetical protein [Candidatus Hodarchaeales archaeon]